MGFIDAIIRGFTQFANFKDRASRSEFWFFALVWILLNLAMTFAVIVMMILFGAFFLVPILGVLYIIFAVPMISLGVRRLHDINRTGLWLLAGSMPIVGAALLLLFFVAPGHEGYNDYGPDPLRYAPSPRDWSGTDDEVEWSQTRVPSVERD